MVCFAESKGNHRIWEKQKPHKWEESRLLTLNWLNRQAAVLKVLVVDRRVGSLWISIGKTPECSLTRALGTGWLEAGHPVGLVKVPLWLSLLGVGDEDKVMEAIIGSVKGWLGIPAPWE